MSLAATLLAMQQADSFFPSGAVAWSWGLETLVNESALGAQAPAGRRRERARDPRGDEVQAFIDGQVRYRWASFDRAFLCAAWLAADDLERVNQLDREVETLTLATEARQGSRRIGQALLGVHAALGTAAAGDYLARVNAGQAPAHVPVIQGLLWRHLGLPLEHAEAASVHGLCTGLVSAALRLGVLGHVDAQRVLAGLQAALREVLAAAAPEPEQAASFIPMAEIAVMRHETQDLRLFAN
jgi:urease accessory protein